MNEKTDRGNQKAHKQDYLTEKLVSDPGRLPSLKAIRGLIGKSEQEEFTRVYLNPTMDEFIEVKTSDIVHSVSTSGESNPLGTSIIWIDKSAAVEHKQVNSSTLQAGFLEGEISKSFSGTTNLVNVIGNAALLGLRRATVFGGIVSIPPNVSVCSTCPTQGEDSCVPATCTLCTGCWTQLLCPTEPKPGEFFK